MVRIELTRILIPCSLFFAMISNADTNMIFHELALNRQLIERSVQSSVSSNLFIIFHAEANGVTTSAFRSDVPVKFGFIAAVTNTSQSYYDVFMLDPAYGCKLALNARDGRSLPLSKLGKFYGKHFDNVSKYDKEELDETTSTWDRPFDREFPYLTKASTQFSLTRGLPPPENLFKISEPGNYTMTVQMQVWACSSDHKSQKSLVKFSPVEITVVKIKK